MTTLKTALADSANVGNIVSSGAVPLLLEDTVWHDLMGYTLGRTLDTTRGHIDYNYDEGTFDFDDSADTSNNRDAVIVNYQLDHNTWRGTGATARAHIHWMQENSGNVKWKAQYRIDNNGEAVGSWVDVADADIEDVVTYSSGTITQITSLGTIDISGCNLSATIKCRLWRDGTDAGDTYGTTKAKVSFFDAHVQVAYLGSQDEYVQ